MTTIEQLTITDSDVIKGLQALQVNDAELIKTIQSLEVSSAYKKELFGHIYARRSRQIPPMQIVVHSRAVLG